MNRPELKKIILQSVLTDAMKNAIREAAPNATLVVIEDNSQIEGEIVDAQVIIGEGVSAEQLERAKELVWHHRPWVGVENIVSDIYAEKDIVLTNGKGTNSANIAEHVIAMMLGFARELPKFFRDQQRKVWREWDEGEKSIHELGGQRVLCLGTGQIGQEVARRLTAFDCELVGASRSGRDVPGFLRCVSFEELDDEVATADSIVNCLPMTPTTAKIVSREMIAKMKPGVRFYNVGRGGTVDQEALIEALQSGHIAAAGLDVVSPEPLNEDSPLWEMKNVMLTSHTAGDSPQSHERMIDLTAEQIRRFQAGEQLLNVVDITAGY